MNYIFKERGLYSSVQVESYIIHHYLTKEKLLINIMIKVILRVLLNK